MRRKFGSAQTNLTNADQNLHFKYSAHTFSFPGCFQASGDLNDSNPYVWKSGPLVSPLNGQEQMDKKFKMAISNSWGIPFNWLTLPTRWEDTNSGTLTSNALMTQYQLHDEFNKSHGIGFSGGGLIRWTYAQRSGSGIGIGEETVSGVVGGLPGGVDAGNNAGRDPGAVGG